MWHNKILFLIFVGVATAATDLYIPSEQKLILQLHVESVGTSKIVDL